MIIREDEEETLSPTQRVHNNEVEILIQKHQNNQREIFIQTHNERETLSPTQRVHSNEEETLTPTQRVWKNEEEEEEVSQRIDIRKNKMLVMEKVFSMQRGAHFDSESPIKRQVRNDDSGIARRGEVRWGGGGGE